MSEPTPLYRRCGLDVAHEAHPNPDGSSCDGAATAAEEEPAEGLAGLLLLADTPRPWALGSLPRELQGDVVVEVGRFVDHYNTTYAIGEAELVPACWPEHPRLLHQLVAVWAAWTEAHLSIGATPAKALDWHQRTLPTFQAQLPGMLGRGNEQCTPAGHRTGWCPAVHRWEEIGKQADQRITDPRTTVRRSLIGWPDPRRG